MKQTPTDDKSQKEQRLVITRHETQGRGRHDESRDCDLTRVDECKRNYWQGRGGVGNESRSTQKHSVLPGWRFNAERLLQQALVFLSLFHRRFLFCAPTSPAHMGTTLARKGAV